MKRILAQPAAATACRVTAGGAVRREGQDCIVKPRRSGAVPDALVDRLRDELQNAIESRLKSGHMPTRQCPVCGRPEPAVVAVGVPAGQAYCKRTGKRCLFVENPSASSLRRALETVSA